MNIKSIIRRSVGRLCGLRRIYNHINNLIPSKNGLNILDIGCGRGELLLLIYKARRGKVSLLGIDSDKDKVIEAERMLQTRARVKLAYATNLPGVVGEFDVIICSLTLHHIEDREKAIEEMFRVLKPGGCIIIAEFVKASNFLGKSIGFFNPCKDISVGVIDQVRVFFKQRGLEERSYDTLFGHIGVSLFQRPIN